MTATTTRNEAAIGLALVSPTGSEIRGTWELVPGVAHASTVDAQGNPEYTGGTDVIWDEQKTITCATTNERLWIDEDGELWRESQLRAVTSSEDDEGNDETIPLFLPEDPLRNGPDAKPHQDREVYGGLILVDHDEYRAMKKRLAELSSAVFTIVSQHKPATKPNEEDYDDTESAYRNGAEVASQEICEKLEAAWLKHPYSADRTGN